MAFPSSPTNGQVHKNYKYSSTTQSWYKHDNRHTFYPGSHPGQRHYVKLFTIDGKSATTGGNIEALLSGPGDYGGHNRGQYTILAVERADIFTCKIYGKNHRYVADPPVFYSKRVEGYKYEVWVYLSDYTFPSRLQVLNDYNVEIGTNAYQFDAPDGLVEIDIIEEDVALTAKLYMSANQNLNIQWQTVNFDSIDSNALNLTSPSANTWQVPLSGKYRISVSGYSNQSSVTNNDRYALGVYKNSELQQFSGANYSENDSPLAAYTGIHHFSTSDSFVIGMYSSVETVILGGIGGSIAMVGHNMICDIEYLGR